MEQRIFKPFGTVSSLTLGGGGIGNVWGETSRAEAIETVNLAYNSGINHFDVAPMYGKGEAEKVLGLALKDKNLEDFFHSLFLKFFLKFQVKSLFYFRNTLL